MHRHRYHAVLAPNARDPSAVVAIGRPQTEVIGLVKRDPPVTMGVDVEGGAEAMKGS
jgi:hypothetical protein